MELETTISKDYSQQKFIEPVTGAEALLLSLLAEGVDTVFGYPGGAIMPVYDALYDYTDRIQHILVRHEQGAAHAAEGYARATGKAGVVFATSGPGATNLVTGLADALMDSVPVVCIVGQVSSLLLGTDAFQEANIMSVTAAVTKWNIQVVNANDIPEAIASAFYIANTGRPGPVLVEITKNAQFECLKEPFAYIKVQDLPYYNPHSTFTQERLEKAAVLLNDAQRPYILAGNGIGISNAEEELIQLAEKAGIPVACTLHGLSCFPAEHPLYVGLLGMHGNYAPNVLTNEADVILAVGMRFDDRVTGDVSRYALQAKIIHIEIDPSEINKTVPATVALQGDAKEILQALIALIHPAGHAEWVDCFKELDREEEELVRKKAISPVDGPLNMAEVINVLSKKAKDDAVIIADVGQHQMMTARYYRFSALNSFYTSGGLGTMGFALPAAMGAKLGNPHREVIAIMGDGCFQMTLQELATIAHYRIPVKLVVLNNNYLGMVRQWQSLFFHNRYSFVEMHNPDFSAVSRAFGVEALPVTKRNELDAALDSMLSSDGPFLLSIEVENEQDVFPMIPGGAAVNEIRLS